MMRKAVNVSMFLRSYSYGTCMGVNELPVEVLNLFLPLVEEPNKKIEFASEIISAGLQGRIDFSRGFNLDAYEATIRKNQHLLKESERKKKSYIDFSGASDDFDEVASKGGIKVEFESLETIEEMKDAFEEVLMNEELEYAVSTIKSLNDSFIADYGTDLIFTLKNAVRGIPQAVTEIKNICTEFSVVSELIETILTSKREVEVLFP